jgi:hypothetical protein
MRALLVLLGGGGRRGWAAAAQVRGGCSSRGGRRWLVVVRWLVPWRWSQTARLFPCSTRRATRVEQRAERGEVVVVDGGEFEFLNFCEIMIDFFSVENDLGEVF